VDRGVVDLIAVTVILLVLTTALQPIVRRIAASSPARDAAPLSVAPAGSGRSEPQPFAAEVLAAADRIDALNGDPGNRAPEIRREVERLRELVRNHS
jgi:hypothetical protein